MNWETVIGLEVHAQLNTESKLFSNGATTFGAQPNTQATFIDAGFPGTLPVLNQKAVNLAIQFGLAIEGKIQQQAYFDRKNYVYPDLPKGYQISQHKRPIVANGFLDILDAQGQSKRVLIQRAHLEEDAGKLLHNRRHQTAVDLNRAGIALLEIVTSPCLSDATEVVNYLKSLNQLLRFLNICNGNMQEGSFRCDVNISLKSKASEQLGTRVEIKNLNSYRFIEKAIAFEQARQATLLATDQVVRQETRLYHEETGQTQSMRDKIEALDYRYFPDPDLMPIFISDEQINTLAKDLPELPSALSQRLLDSGLSVQDCDYLLSSPALYRYFQALTEQSSAPKKLLINWLKGPVSALLNEGGQHIESFKLSPPRFAELLNAIAEGKLSQHQGKVLMLELIDSDKPLEDLIKSLDMKAPAAADIDAKIQSILDEYPTQVQQYLQGEEKILGFLMGQVMKSLANKADPNQIQQQLLNQLKNTGI